MRVKPFDRPDDTDDVRLLIHECRYIRMMEFHEMLVGKLTKPLGMSSITSKTARLPPVKSLVHVTRKMDRNA